MIDHVMILGYSAFMFLGAFFGARAGSKISLIMGLTCGVLILLGDVIRIYSPKNGYLFLLIVTGILVVVFLQRLLTTKMMMPSGMLLMVTVLFFGFILLKYLK